MILTILFSVALGVVGSFLYRARGVDEVTIISRSFERWLIAALLTSLVLFSVFSLSWLFAGLASLSLVGSYLGIATGHGAYYHLWYNSKIVEEDNLKVQTEDDEKIQPLVKLLTRDLPPLDWRYKAVGLALTGLLVTILPGICFIILKGGLLKGVGISLSGLLKVPSYALGNLVRRVGLKFQKGTQWGEYFFGFSLFATVALLAL